MVNKFEIIGDVAYISVQHKGNELKVEVDASDIDRILGEVTGSINIRHTSPKYGKCFYVYYNKYSDRKRVDFPLHRFILNNPPRELVVDHIDGDTLNNKSSNLRAVTQQQNCQNQRVRKNNVSGERGVYFDKGKNRWIATVFVRKKAYRKVRKTFDEAVEAVRELRAMHMPYSMN